MEMHRLAATEVSTGPLLVGRLGSVDLDRAVRALGDLAWLGRLSVEPADRPDLRRITTVFELPSRGGSATGAVRHATFIDIGQVQPVGDHGIVEFAWLSAQFAPLFPVFAGQLRISTDDIVLDGRYAPPLGTLGLRMDRALLHFVARRTAGALLERLVREFEP